MHRLSQKEVQKLSNTYGTLASLVGKVIQNCQPVGSTIHVDYNALCVNHEGKRETFDDYPVRKTLEAKKPIETHLDDLKLALIMVTPRNAKFKVVCTYNDECWEFAIDAATPVELYKQVFGEFDFTTLSARDGKTNTELTGWLWDLPKQLLWHNGSLVISPANYRFNYVLFVDGPGLKLILTTLFASMSNRNSPRPSPRKRRLLPAVTPPPRILRKEDLTQFCVVNQVDMRLILATVGRPFKLVAIDQHAADERVHYEQLLRAVTDEKALVNLLVCTCSPRVARNLRHFGIVIEDDVVTEIPRLLEGISTDQLRKGILNHSEDLNSRRKPWVPLGESAFASYPSMILTTASSVACRISIKFGQKLSMAEMKGLLEDLSQCIDPFQCAHGRPAITLLESSLIN